MVELKKQYPFLVMACWFLLVSMALELSSDLAIIGTSGRGEYLIGVLMIRQVLLQLRVY
jgi:hypothetical protein